MKQYISEAQYKSLTEEQEDKLDNYLLKINLFFDYYKPKSMTIGKMIEILNVSLKGRLKLVELFQKNYLGLDGRAFKEDSKDGDWLNGIDLCDALWDIIINDIITE